MGRALRVTAGDAVYHVLNRANGRQALFDDEGDYAAFERVLAEAQQRVPMRLLAYCLMPNHWHLVLWPFGDGDLSEQKKGVRSCNHTIAISQKGGPITVQPAF